ncbi:hypothetical protein ACQP2F_14105 [Actinoplanes sp. CA-030573]|uniref:hypothetical protein n=1 Tax=Actinoplanes sp. CA-030573 TaxID=3239898 RepID=UPI003D8B4105
MAPDNVAPWAQPIDDEQDVVNALLSSAVGAGHTVERLHALAATDPHIDRQATDDLIQAIAAMTSARRRLLHYAQQLSNNTDP